MIKNKKRIVVFTGAGVSQESGISTFRDNDGLWKRFDFRKLADIKGWREDPAAVLEFYNTRRAQLGTVVPNKAHELVAKLEEKYDVWVVTQNVDDLHERAGSTKVLHLHGELTKMCSSKNKEDHKCIEYWPADRVIKIGDKAKDGSQLRPYIVWFGEPVPNYEDAAAVVQSADILVVIGTSLNVAPANMLAYISTAKQNIVIDPNDYANAPENFVHIKQKATDGMETLYNRLMKE